MGLESLKVTAGGTAAEPAEPKIGDVNTGPNGETVLSNTPEPDKPGATDGGTEERPEWLPEKFKTPADMAKAYAELEKKQSGKPATEEGEPEGQGTSDKTAADTVADAGFDLAALTAEYEQNDGALTAETLKALQAKGITRAAVDGYIAGQQAVAREIRSGLAEIAGSADDLDATLTWARANLDEGGKAAFDAALDSGNTSLINLAFQAVHTQFVADNGKAPKNVGGADAGAAGVKQYESWDDVVLAMQDKRYHTSPEYRAQVDKRLAMSEKL